MSSPSSGFNRVRRTMDYLQSCPQIKLPVHASLREAMEVITRTQSGVAVIVGDHETLLGIIVDSDIRRALLRGDSLDVPVSTVMNTDPFTASHTLSHDELVDIFREKRKAYIPLVDPNSRLVALAALVDYLEEDESSSSVIIMAGGRGKRLRPLTDAVPKPMVKVANKPILEHDLEYLKGFGLNKFVFSINYLGDQIRDHFEDGSKWGVQIDYVSESSDMGTAGALGLIEGDLGKSFIVMNGDLLTKVNIRALLEFHRTDKNLATICVRQYDFQVPYGVVSLDGSRFGGLVEKPVHRFFVNAGIYVLEPEVLKWLKKDAPCDMPEFLEEIRRREPQRVGCFPIQEYWLDIGRPEDYERAITDFGTNAG